MADRYTKQEVATRRADAIEKLRELAPPGTDVYTILRGVARSGMSRTISVIVMAEGEPSDISWLVARAGDWRQDDRYGALKVSGAGMDMGFHVVHNLGYALYPAGFGCVGQHCPSNDHSNGDRDYNRDNRELLAELELNGSSWRPEPIDHWHASGAYALRQRWL